MAEEVHNPVPDPVLERIRQMIGEKRRENEDLKAYLEALDKGWEDGQKNIEESIIDAVKFAVVDNEIAERAQASLDAEVKPLKAGEGFEVFGSVADEDSRIGIPGAEVTIVRDVDGKEEIISISRTDRFGHYRAPIKKELLEKPDDKTHLRVIIRKDDGATLGEIAKEVTLKPGGNDSTSVLLPTDKKNVELVMAGKTIKRSIEHTREVASKRLETMRTSHTDVVAMAGSLRARIRDISESLSAPPPDITIPPEDVPISSPPPGVAPPAPPPEPTAPTPPSEPTDETPEIPKPTIPPTGKPTPPSKSPKPGPAKTPPMDLGRIKDIGPKRAADLKRAGISDVAAFRETSPEKLREILGSRINVGTLKRRSVALLEEAEKKTKEKEPAPPAPTVELEGIKGIGPKRAADLKRAGITGVAAFRKASSEKLREVLGSGVSVGTLKQRSIVLLEEAGKIPHTQKGKPKRE